MNEEVLKSYILLALNYPGQKGKMNSATDILKKVCRIAETDMKNFGDVYSVYVDETSVIFVSVSKPSYN